MHKITMLCITGNIHRHRVKKKKRLGQSRRQKVTKKVRLNSTSTRSHKTFDTEINESA